jgi:hypothetical protein
VLKFFHEISQRHPEGFTDVVDFHKIQTPFGCLVSADKRLGLSQQPRHLGLPKAGLDAQTLQECGNSSAFEAG